MVSLLWCKWMNEEMRQLLKNVVNEHLGIPVMSKFLVLLVVSELEIVPGSQDQGYL